MEDREYWVYGLATEWDELCVNVWPQLLEWLMWQFVDDGEPLVISDFVMSWIRDNQFILECLGHKVIYQPVAGFSFLLELSRKLWPVLFLLLFFSVLILDVLSPNLSSKFLGLMVLIVLSVSCHRFHSNSWTYHRYLKNLSGRAAHTFKCSPPWRRDRQIFVNSRLTGIPSQF